MRGSGRILGLAGAGLLVAAAAAPVAWADPVKPPAPGTPGADEIETAYLVMLAVGVVIAVAVNAALILAVLRFRARRGREAHRVRSRPRTQWRFGILAGLIATGCYVVGIVYTEGSRETPAQAAGKPLSIDVSGQQWLWRYEYPDGTFSYYELVLPVDTPIQLEMDSTDVMHRWWVPALGGMVDAVPGQVKRTRLVATREGVYEGRSTQFSGPAYAAMRTRVRVVDRAAYERWIAQQRLQIRDAQREVQEAVDAGVLGEVSGGGPEPVEAAPGSEAPRGGR